MAEQSQAPRRRYDATRRRELGRASRAATSDAVVEAAARLFTSQGYVRTTIKQIAYEASVSEQTIYVVFRSKREVLKALMDKRVSRDGPGPPFPAAGEGAPDARTVLRQLAAGGTRLFERAAPIWAITREAAAADPVIAKWWEAEMDRRHANFRRYVQMLPERSLKAGLARDAAVDIFWTVASPETFEALVGRRGWTPKEFETWIAEATADLLLG
jgi:AcrR family transcriptional regulator